MGRVAAALNGFSIRYVLIRVRSGLDIILRPFITTNKMEGFLLNLFSFE